jgi:endonuclease G, mitochondrial
MKKLLAGLFLALTTLASTQAFAWTQRAPGTVQQCSVHAPYGLESTSKTLVPICRQAYLVAYDAADKIPDNVSWTLTPDHALGCVARSNAFVADASVTGGATPQDYAGTGYDKGHMAPDGDQSWDQQVEYESFLMTNMNPQAGSLNRGIWKLLETSFRGWAYQLNTPMTAYAGAIYAPTDKTIGKGVRVPHAFYKIVINQKTGEVAGWEFPHTAPYPNLGNDLTKFRKPIADIQKEAGVTFKYPAGAKELQPGKEWPVDFGALTNQKRKLCGANASDD